MIANWRHIRKWPNGVKDAYFAFTAHRVAQQCPTSSLWLADDCHYSVMASGHANSNQVGVTKR